MLVAYQGIPGAYSEMAATEFFPSRTTRCRSFENFDDVFKAVVQGRVSYGVLPLENALTGSIHQNYDLLLHHDVAIIGEVKLKIDHCLLAHKKATLADIRQIYSHPQALAQCETFIQKQKKASPAPFFDTAGSARFVSLSGRQDFAAIASAAAGKQYGLKVLKKGIANDTHNFTRFIVIQKAKSSVSRQQRKASDKSSIVFALKSLPGALHKALGVLASKKIDLLKIESRPIPGNPWQYIFYLDFVTPKGKESPASLLLELSELTVFTKWLGTYPSS